MITLVTAPVTILTQFNTLKTDSGVITGGYTQKQKIPWVKSTTAKLTAYPVYGK